MSDTRIVKRYQNRKLYDCQDSCYVTLQELHAIFKTSPSVKVVDNKTKADITAKTLMACLFDKEMETTHDVGLLLKVVKSEQGTFTSLLKDTLVEEVAVQSEMVMA